MDKQLTKKEYLGEGYVHQFRHIKTGEVTTVPCTQEEYESLSLENGHLNNPTLEDHNWIGSAGKTIKVDTPSTLLGVNEYCDFKGGYFVNVLDDQDKLKSIIVDKGDVVNDTIASTKIDTPKWR